MRGPLPKGWLLDKDVAYGQPCANYKDTMKYKVDFITRFGKGALDGSEQSTRTESDHDYTQRVRDRAAARYYKTQASDLRFLDSVLGFERKSPKQMAIVQRIADTVLRPEEAKKIETPRVTVRIESGEAHLSRIGSLEHQIQGQMARMGVFATREDILDAEAMDKQARSGFACASWDDMNDYEDQ